MSKFSWFLLGIVVLIATIIVYNKVLHPKETAPAGPAGGPPKELSVSGFVVQPQDIENGVVATGTLLANEEVDLHAEISGKIVGLYLNEGEAVAKGTLLLKLYDADLQAQLKKLAAQKTTAVTNEQRLKQLLAVNGVGQQEYDNALTLVQSLEADIEYTQAQISKTEVRAPFDGVIGLKSVSIGAYVSPGTTIASLQQTNPLKIDFTVPEKYFGSLSKNDVVKFQVNGSDETYTGTVYAIEPRVEEATRSIRVRARVANTKQRLFPGAFAKVDLGLKSIEGALMLPTHCIIPEARNKKVVVLKQGKAQFRSVQTGLRNESRIQILDGVEAGDTVIASALMSVKPEMVLKVVKLID